MIENPLIIPVLEVLRRHEGAISEYELLKLLEQELVELLGSKERAELLLFRKHFLLMNALYQLQASFYAEGLSLHISPLAIYLEGAGGGDALELVDSAEQALRSYYLDWQQFYAADEVVVNDLLNNFWQRYLAVDKQLESCRCLGLELDASWSEIKTAYRHQAAQHHPDRGGDAGEFMAIREAYEMLKQARAC